MPIDHIEPPADGTWDLGAAAARFKDLIISGDVSDGTNATSPAEINTAYEHSQIVTGNPHAVTASDVAADPAGTAAAAVVAHESTYDHTAIGNAVTIRGVAVSVATPADGEALVFSASNNQYEPTTASTLTTVATDATISGDGTVGDPLVVVANGHVHNLANISDAGTAAAKDVPAFGVDATTAQVVMGDDSRLDDTRTPILHATTHESGGVDATNHDSLAGFVAGEHILHSAVTVGVSSDLAYVSGTGTIDASMVIGLSDTGAVAGTYGTNSFISVAVDAKGRISDITEVYPTLNDVRFDITPTPPTGEGYIFWDVDEKTLSITSDVAAHTLQIGREMVVRVVNKTGVLIDDGKVVYISGAQGNRPTIALAAATSSTNVRKILGVVTADIGINAEGYVTVFGIVKGFNTSGFTEGDTLYVSDTAGSLTNVAPVGASTPAIIGQALNSTVSGTILVRPQAPDAWLRLTTSQGARKEPTGFESPELVTSSYNSATRVLTITQSGGVVIWISGTKFIKTSPVTVTAHSATPANYYLTMDSAGDLNWSTSVWAFSTPWVAKVAYGNITGCTALPIQEHHGLMPWQSHLEMHERIGTYVRSGALLTSGTYAVQPAAPTDADNTPGIDAGVIADEDLPYTFDAWTQGTYTRGWADNTNALNLETGVTAVPKITGTYPNYYTGAATTEMATNQYANIYLILLSTTGDAASKNYRAVWLQPFAAYSTLTEAEGEEFGDYPCINEIASKIVEYVPWVRMTIRTNASYSTTGKFRIAKVSYLSGSRVNPVVISDGTTVQNESIIRDISDETTDLTTGLAKVTFRMPFAMSVTSVRASVNTAPTGATIIVDINEATTSILSTKLSIDASEFTSTTAATPAVISDPLLADDAEITIDIDQVGSTIAGKGLKVVINGTRA